MQLSAGGLEQQQQDDETQPVSFLSKDGCWIWQGGRRETRGMSCVCCVPFKWIKLHRALTRRQQNGPPTGARWWERGFSCYSRAASTRPVRWDPLLEIFNRDQRRADELWTGLQTLGLDCSNPHSQPIKRGPLWLHINLPFTSLMQLKRVWFHAQKCLVSVYFPGLGSVLQCPPTINLSGCMVQAKHG